MKIEVDVLGSPSLISLIVFCGRKATLEKEALTHRSRKDPHHQNNKYSGGEELAKAKQPVCFITCCFNFEWWKFSDALPPHRERPQRLLRPRVAISTSTQLLSSDASYHFISL